MLNRLNQLKHLVDSKHINNCPNSNRRIKFDCRLRVYKIMFDGIQYF